MTITTPVVLDGTVITDQSAWAKASHLSRSVAMRMRHIWVDSETGDDANDGSSQFPKATMAGAFAIAEEGDVIRPLAGHYESMGVPVRRKKD